MKVIYNKKLKSFELWENKTILLSRSYTNVTNIPDYNLQLEKFSNECLTLQKERFAEQMKTQLNKNKGSFVLETSSKLWDRLKKWIEENRR